MKAHLVLVLRINVYAYRHVCESVCGALAVIAPERLEVPCAARDGPEVLNLRRCVLLSCSSAPSACIVPNLRSILRVGRAHVSLMPPPCVVRAGQRQPPARRGSAHTKRNGPSVGGNAEMDPCRAHFLRLSPSSSLSLFFSFFFLFFFFFLIFSFFSFSFFYFRALYWTGAVVYRPQWRIWPV